MKLNEIRTFIAVADAQSVQEAGNRLGLTQSAVSRLIQRLEAELGVVLFDRQTKPLALTRDGELALAHARRVLAAAGDFADAFAGAAEPRGLLKLGVAHVLTALAAGRPLDELRAGFPGLTFRLQSDWSTPLIEQVRAGSLDGALVLLCEDEEPPEDLPVRRLSSEPVSIVAGPDGTPNPGLAAMNSRGWVLQPSGCRYRNALHLALAPLGQQPNVTVEAFDQSLLVALVARGVGYGLAPLRLIAPIPAASSLRPVDVPGFRLRVTVWLVQARTAGRIGPVFDRLEAVLHRQLDACAPVLHSAAE
ncbi:LysR family transcriptional regulator [Azospirillum picis]|uniref:DNA-binding transcriptional LysR family regulator n=1 Tax=Azospirillum picis TaxID=488438 RepID=A0ABU0MJM4_9PROT|nr:LysR family transcriptional regulator [Azospirillum picis]MBP2299457.1 DNA-binding transcriptional LysR family regulator [Azospirillum picis]MDQ0533416.1 DNA-binding transcriptional LysR family regulator [Azospirillum picis]